MVDALRPQLQLSHKKCKHFLWRSLCMLLHGHDRVLHLGLERSDNPKTKGGDGVVVGSRQ